MKTSKEKVFEYIIEYTKEFKNIEEEPPMFNTKFLSEQLGMQRTNVSTVLNQLAEEGKLMKTNGRPVMFYLSAYDSINKIDFSNLIGWDTSLEDIFIRIQAAITYPIRMPRILFTGEKGVGIRTISHSIYEFACAHRIIKKESQYMILDCSSFNEEQLKDKLLGTDNIFSIANGGLILIKNIECVPYHVINDVITLLKNIDYNFILLVYLEDMEKISYIKEYFNFIIHIPSLEKRTLMERYQFIEKFFKEEAVKLNKKIEVNYGLMSCLMVYQCKDNLIELRNNIQYGVANANIRTKRNENIILTLNDLNANVRKGLLHIKGNKNELEKILEKDTSYIFTLNSTLRLKNKKTIDDIYHQLDQDYKMLGKHTSSKDIDDYIYAHIEYNLNDYLEKLCEGMTSEKLDSLVSDKLQEMVKEFIDEASHYLNRVYSNKVYYGLCLHLNNALISRIQKQRISNAKVMQIIETYDQEYLFSRKFIKRVQEVFHVHFSLDESIFITLLLVNDHSLIKDSEVVTLIAMHGENTASSIVDVIRKLMPVKNLEPFDLSLDIDIEISYDLLKQKILNIHQGKGILVLYDMGSIQMMLTSIKEETGIEIMSIEVPIPLLAMSAFKGSEEGKSLNEIYQYLVSQYNEITYPSSRNKDIVIALSTLKENNSDSIRRYLETLEDYRDYRILAFNISDKQSLIHKINEIQINGKVIGIVGTYNPDIFNIKYCDYQHLPHVSSIHELFLKVDEDFDVLHYLVEQFDIFNEDDLCKTLPPFIENLQNIFHVTFNEDTRYGLLIHMGCLIDRLNKKQGSSVNFKLNEIKSIYSKEYEAVSQALSALEETFQVVFDDNDKATVIEIIINFKRRNKK